MANGKRIVIGTRGSLLARWQANHIATLLRAAHPGLVVDEKIIVTEGDRLSVGPLWNAGGKGVWVKEIEAALAAGEIDLAVHSMKDVPAVLLDGLAIAAIPPRADVRDAVVSQKGVNLMDLPGGSRVGTTSLRRQSQVLAVRKDLSVEILRGNLDTRLRKVAEGVVDAAILACAGMDRLGFADRIVERLSVDRMLPAVGQGALAIETRAGDGRTRTLCAVLNDPDTETAMAAERAFLAALGASCRTPVAGYAVIDGPEVVLRGLVGMPDGSATLRDEARGSRLNAASVGDSLGQRFLARGAGSYLASAI